MYAIKDLDSEVSMKAEEMVTNGEMPKNWLVLAVMKDHTDLHGDDALMALCCMRETVATRVNKYFSAVKAAEEETPQIPLPGFERLQRRYVIRRNKEQTIVSVYSMTDEELENKAVEMEAMAEGCLKHADELRKFKSERMKQA